MLPETNCKDVGWSATGYLHFSVFQGETLMLIQPQRSAQKGKQWQKAVSLIRLHTQALKYANIQLAQCQCRTATKQPEYVQPNHRLAPLGLEQCPQPWCSLRHYCSCCPTYCTV